MEIGGSLIGVSLCVFSAALVVHRWQMRNAAIRSEAWLKAKAVILSSRVTEKNCDIAVLFSPSVSYSYDASGKKLIYNQISFGLQKYSLQEARQVVDRYYAGNEVSVRFDPANPENAVLEQQGRPNRVDSFEIALVMLGCVMFFY